MSTAIGTVRNVTPADPRFTRNTPSLDWMPTADGIQILDARAGTSVWVEFRIRPEQFTATAWDAAKANYADGDLVYYSTTRECYECLEDNPAAGTVPTTTATWRKIDFPYVLARAVQCFAYAHALEDDGQMEKARAQRDMGEDLLGIEWSKQESQQDQVRSYRVLSR